MAKITKDMLIGDIIEIDQRLIPVLLMSGMHCIGCPASQGESLEEAAFVHGIDPDELEQALNEQYEKLMAEESAQTEEA